MSNSLHGRLIVLLLLLLAAAVAAGLLMTGLFRQSASAQAAQRQAEIARACDAIVDRYRFYTTDWPVGNDAANDVQFRRGLVPVVQTALRDRAGVEGGIWQRASGSLAYAFPTYEGSGPKVDVPQAELPRIRSVNESSAADERAVNVRYSGGSQTLLLTACPLTGPVPDLTAWAMTRVTPFAGRAYEQLMAGLSVLLLTVLAATLFLSRLMVTWSRHVARLECEISSDNATQLPELAPTGERELDRIVDALNDARKRLATAREREAQLAAQVVSAQRLAAMGRMTAGVAHEIRNPIAAMRLKAENAMAAGGTRQGEALSVILTQIDRLDHLLKRLLNVTERDEVHQESVELAPFLEECRLAHEDVAHAREVTLTADAGLEFARFDPALLRRALDNLVLNALQAAPSGSTVKLTVYAQDNETVFEVVDHGPGPPSAVCAHLFESFNTGRSEGTGLGLSIVREIAELHGGTARFVRENSLSRFQIWLPWQPS
jgi:signal transduction histidine kinase